MDRWKPICNGINKRNKWIIRGDEKARGRREETRFLYRRHTAQSGLDSQVRWQHQIRLRFLWRHIIAGNKYRGVTKKIRWNVFGC